MVQVLPGVPTFAQQLIPQINQAIGTTVEGYQRGQTKKNDAAILEKFGSLSPGTSPLEVIKLIGQLSSDSQKSLSPLFSELFKQQGIQSATSAKNQEELKPFVDSVKRLEELKSYTGSQSIPFASNYDPTKAIAEKVPFIGEALGKGVSLNREALQKRQEIETEGTVAADYAYNKLLGNKGTLTDTRIKNILSKFQISPKDSERVYEGKLSALKRIAGLSEQGVSADEAIRIAEKEFKSQESSLPPSKLEPGTDEYRVEAQKILKEANGDVKKAEAIARKRGFRF